MTDAQNYRVTATYYVPGTTRTVVTGGDPIIPNWSSRERWHYLEALNAVTIRAAAPDGSLVKIAACSFNLCVQHPCGCPADTATTPLRGFRAQCGSCAAVFDVPAPAGDSRPYVKPAPGSRAEMNAELYDQH